MISLTPTEELIMQCLWESDEDLMVYDVREKLMEKTGKDYASNAVATYLGILLKKGAVSRYKKRHSHQYHIEIDFDEYRRQKLLEFERLWYGGSTAQMLSSAVEAKKYLSEEDKKRIMELIADDTDSI